MDNKLKRVTAAQSLAAGLTAGGMEALITYPTEFVKTRQQLLSSTSTTGGKSSPLHILVSTVRTSGVRVLYTGAPAFCISNASKSGVRFLVFDAVRARLPHDQRTGKPTALSTMLAGAVAGVAESISVVTPGENLKTKIVDDRAAAIKGQAPQFRSSSHALRTIIATDGFSALWRGLLPVSLKQGSNALVRFTSYSALLNVIQPLMTRHNLAGAAAVSGALAGIITVYATMPFDVVKTKMQSLAGQAQYNGTWDCVRQTWHEAGPKAFWKGTTPRLARLTVSGALSFSIYAGIVDILQANSQHQEEIKGVSQAL